MIEKSDITGALEACGLQWAEPSFAPRKAPQAPYATISDTYSYDGADEHVGLIGHDTSIYLYDGGGTAGYAIRASLARELASRNIKFNQYPADYSYDYKLFSTEYDITETYFEKWSDDNV